MKFKYTFGKNPNEFFIAVHDFCNVPVISKSLSE